jgi:two-component system heavy metal sensor histidine kinase CusS
MIAIVMFVTALTMGSALAGVSAVFNNAQKADLDRALIEVARAEAREAPANGYRFSARAGPAANDVGPLTKFGVIYDKQGRPLSMTEPFDRAPPRLSSLPRSRERPFDFHFAGMHLRCVLIGIPQSQAVLLLAASAEDLDGDEVFLNEAMLAAFALAVVWAGILAHWMVRRQVRHHEILAQVARRVAAGDLNARVETLSPDPEVAQLGRDIDAMVAQLSALMSTQERFVAHAAHELRSPLAALYGELQQALRRNRDAAEYRATIERAIVSARRLNHLAEDLLTLARLRGPEQPAEPVRVEEVIANVVSLVRTAAEEKHIQLNVIANVGPMLGRAQDLERMLRNLVENAVEFAPRDDTVTLTATMTPETVEFIVEDHGPGIPDDERERIFEPFYRNSKARSVAPRGAGLGLSIARQIARAHGGDVRVSSSSSAPAGASFTATIPRHASTGERHAARD